MDLQGAQQAGSYIEQAFPTLPGQRYQLSFFYANNPDAPSASGGVKLSGLTTLDEEMLTHEGSTRGSMNYTPFSVSFVPDSSQTTLRFTRLSSAYGDSLVLDAVSVVLIALLPTYSLSAITEGGGIVIPDPLLAGYPSNTLVTLRATPASGWTFLGWMGDANGSTPVFTLQMNRNECVRALFGTSLRVTADGNGAVFFISAPGGLYRFGSTVRLTAIPQADSYFVGWNNAAAGSPNPLSFLVNNANPTVTALFAPLSSAFALTAIPDGNGRVTVNPRANRYTNEQSVTLTAMPDAGQTFSGWTGDASGTQNPLVITMSQSKVITANFTKRPYLNVLNCFGQLNGDTLHLTLTGILGEPYAIEGSSNLLDWAPLATMTNLLGVVQFDDPFATNKNQRFYRAVK